MSSREEAKSAWRSMSNVEKARAMIEAAEADEAPAPSYMTRAELYTGACAYLLLEQAEKESFLQDVRRAAKT